MRLQVLKHGACRFVQVFCNGEEVLTVSGTKEKYVVDVWSGNHPFYLVRLLGGVVPAVSVCMGESKGGCGEGADPSR